MSHYVLPSALKLQRPNLQVATASDIWMTEAGKSYKQRTGTISQSSIKLPYLHLKPTMRPQLSVRSESLRINSESISSSNNDVPSSVRTADAAGGATKKYGYIQSPPKRRQSLRLTDIIPEPAAKPVVVADTVGEEENFGSPKRRRSFRLSDLNPHPPDAVEEAAPPTTTTTTQAQNVLRIRERLPPQYHTHAGVYSPSSMEAKLMDTASTIPLDLGSMSLQWNNSSASNSNNNMNPKHKNGNNEALLSKVATQSNGLHVVPAQLNTREVPTTISGTPLDLNSMLVPGKPRSRRASSLDAISLPQKQLVTIATREAFFSKEDATWLHGGSSTRSLSNASLSTSAPPIGDETQRMRPRGAGSNNDASRRTIKLTPTKTTKTNVNTDSIMCATKREITTAPSLVLGKDKESNNHSSVRSSTRNSLKAHVVPLTQSILERKNPPTPRRNLSGCQSPRSPCSVQWSLTDEEEVFQQHHAHRSQVPVGSSSEAFVLASPKAPARVDHTAMKHLIAGRRTSFGPYIPEM